MDQHIKETTSTGQKTRNRRILSSVFLGCVVMVLGCEQQVTAPDLSWYPSIIEGYMPYTISGGGLPLKPGQTMFTEEEMIHYTQEFIDQRRDLIGADSKSLRLVEVQSASDSLYQSWRVSYEQIRPYKLPIGGYTYGKIWFSIDNGKITFFQSTVIPEVPVPDRAIVSNDVIRKRLMGQKLPFDLPSGQYKGYEITAATQLIFKDLVILPKLTGKTLEIRLGREIRVIARDIANLEWVVFYDVITDEIVNVIPLFVI